MEFGLRKLNREEGFEMKDRGFKSSQGQNNKPEHIINQQRLWVAVIKRHIVDYKKQNKHRHTAKAFLKGIDLDLICEEFLFDVCSADYIRKHVFAEECLK